LQVRAKLEAEEAAKKAAEEQRRQLLRGTPPEMPKFIPPEEEKMEPWPEYERIMKVSHHQVVHFVCFFQSLLCLMLFLTVMTVTSTSKFWRQYSSEKNTRAPTTGK
jgi:thiosulfate reductase cytochrome b subunit